MNINIGETIELDDNNTYFVVSKVKHGNKNYYYLLNEKNNDNYMFCYEENDELVEVIDDELILKLNPLFVKNTFDSIKDNS